MYISDEIRVVDSLSVTAGATQHCPKTGEFLADATGHTRLYLVKGADGWSAYTRKHELPAEAFREFDDVGLALELRLNNPTGYFTPYKNIVVVPLGMRARIENDQVVFGRDDLREYLVSNYRPTDQWDDELLVWPDADQTNTTMLLSGGMDSVAVLLSHHLAGRPLPALHVARPGLEHELELAQEVSRRYAVKLDTPRFTSVKPDEAFAHLEFSPFGRSFNFPFYNRVFKSSLTTHYALHGELSLIDMQFYDHAQRFTSARRAMFHDARLRRLFTGVRAIAGVLPEIGGDTKVATILRSLRTARNKRLYILGTLIGPKGFPGVATSGFGKDEDAFIDALEKRFEPFIDGSDDPKHFDIDFFLVAYRAVEGMSNKNGPQEAALSSGHETRHPMNKLETLLRQVSITGEAARHKTVLKKHFYEKFPELESVMWFKKTTAIGKSSEPLWVEGADWHGMTQAALSNVTGTSFVSWEKYAADLRSRTWGESHINVTTLLKRRELALRQVARTPEVSPAGA